VENKPNYFVVGAAKAGTTSLYNWLNQHPEVSVPMPKEPSYFVRNYGCSDWQRYLSFFPIRGETRAIVDTSASYLAAPESPAWIFKELGSVKIIIVLRNPAHRAYSLYSWMVMEGYENNADFDQALAEETVRSQSEEFYWHNPEYSWDYMYFQSGLYFEQVKRYLDIFGRENVKIYLFEDLIKNSSSIIKDLYGFLNVSTDFVPTFSHENKSKLPRFVGLQYLLRVSFYKVTGKFPAGLRPLINRARGPMIDLNRRIGRAPHLSPKTEYTLCLKYKNDIEKLSDLIRMDLSSWIEPKQSVELKNEKQ
jgi:hypothetical protein